MRCAVVIVLLCACERPPPLLAAAVAAVEPASVVEGSSVRITIHGRFDVERRVDFATGVLDIDAGYGVYLGGNALEDVTYRDASTLDATVPTTLHRGVYDLIVAGPGGRAVLTDAFAVLAPPPNRLVVSSVPGPDPAAAVGTRALYLGQTVELYAVSYHDETFVRQETVDWEVAGGIGTLAPARGTATIFTAAGAGTGRIRAAAGELVAETGDFIVAACTSTADCDDRDVCTGAEKCEATGWCLAGTPLMGTACDGPDSDHCADDVVVACTPAGPVCSSGEDDSEGPAGDATCTDSVDNDCDGAADGVDLGCSDVNLPPLAVLTVTPAAGVAGASSFVASAAASSDAPYPRSSLKFAYDWGESSGFVFVEGPAQVEHRYAVEGRYLVSLRVTDAGGLSSYASFEVQAVAPAELIEVDTGSDAQQPGATPSDPGEDKVFSLREAVAYAATTRTVETIVVPAGTIIDLLSTLSISDSVGVDIVADGAVLNGARMSSGSCVSVDGNNVRLNGLEITGCPGLALEVTGGNGIQVSRCFIHGNADSVSLDAAGATFGPGNEIAGHPTSGVQLKPGVAGVRIVGNRIHHNGGKGGVELQNSGGDPAHIIEQNVLYANTADGVYIKLTANVVVRHNTIDGNAGAGVNIDKAKAAVLVNNAITNNGGCWVLVLDPESTPARYERNAQFANGGTGCLVADVSSIVDPHYINASFADYRLAPGSPLVDAGVDLGLDVNGPAGGLYDGTAPDIGAFETPVAPPP